MIPGDCEQGVINNTTPGMEKQGHVVNAVGGAGMVCTVKTTNSTVHHIKSRSSRNKGYIGLMGDKDRDKDREQGQEQVQVQGQEEDGHMLAAGGGGEGGLPLRSNTNTHKHSNRSTKSTATSIQGHHQHSPPHRSHSQKSYATSHDRNTSQKHHTSRDHHTNRDQYASRDDRSSHDSPGSVRSPRSPSSLLDHSSLLSSHSPTHSPMRDGQVALLPPHGPMVHDSVTWGTSLALCVLFIITAIPAPLSVSVSAFVLYSFATRVMEIIVATLLLTPFVVHQPDMLVKTLPTKSGICEGALEGDHGDSSVPSVSSPLHHDGHSMQEQALLPTIAVVNHAKSSPKFKSSSPGMDKGDVDDNDDGNNNDDEDRDRDKDGGKDRRLPGEEDSIVSSMTTSVFVSHKSGPTNTTIKGGISAKTTSFKPIKSSERSNVSLMGWSPRPVVASPTDAMTAAVVRYSSQDSVVMKKSTLSPTSKGNSVSKVLYTGASLSLSLKSSSRQIAQSKNTDSKGRDVTAQMSSGDEHSERSKVTFSNPAMTTDVYNGYGSKGSDFYDEYTYAPSVSPSQQLTQRRRSSSGDSPDSPRSPTPRSPRRTQVLHTSMCNNIDSGKQTDIKSINSSEGLGDQHPEQTGSVVTVGTGKNSRVSAVLANIADYYPQTTEMEQGHLHSLNSTKSGDLLPSYHSTAVGSTKGGSVSSHSPKSSHSSSSSHGSHASRRPSSSRHQGFNHSPKDSIPTDPTDTIPTPLPVDQVLPLNYQHPPPSGL